MMVHTYRPRDVETEVALRQLEAMTTSDIEKTIAGLKAHICLLELLLTRPDLLSPPVPPPPRGE